MSDLPAVNSVVFSSWFETREGKELVNIKRLAKAFGKEEKHYIEIISNASEIFKGEHFEFSRVRREKSVRSQNQKITRGRPQKDHYLTRDGCLAFLNRLDYNRYDPEIGSFIIAFQKWLISTAGKVLDGKLVTAESIPLNYHEERAGTKNNHKLLMRTLKNREIPKFIGRINPRKIYQRESSAINEDVAGVHIHGLSDKMNPTGLHIKNDAYVADIALIEAGIECQPRHNVVKKVLDASYPSRSLPDMLLTSEEKARISRKCPESQSGLSDFTAVTA